MKKTLNVIIIVFTTAAFCTMILKDGVNETTLILWEALGLLIIKRLID